MMHSSILATLFEKSANERESQGLLQRQLAANLEIVHSHVLQN